MSLFFHNMECVKDQSGEKGLALILFEEGVWALFRIASCLEDLLINVQFLAGIEWGLFWFQTIQVISNKYEDNKQHT